MNQNENETTEVSALESAIRQNHSISVQQLLSEPISMESKDIENAYHLALKQNNIDVIRIFFQAALSGSLGEIITPITVFRHAMSKQQYDIVTETISNPHFDSNAEDLWTNDRPLSFAVFNNQLDLSKLLLQRGAVTDAVNAKGMTALSVSCVKSSVDCCKLLLSHGASANPTGTSGNSPLRLIYCYFKDRELFRLMVHLLIFAAINLNKEKWLTSMILPSHSSVDKELHENLKELCAVPLSLKMSCFTTIRCHMVNKYHGVSILGHLHHLPLPDQLIKYLTLENIDI